MSKIPNIQDLNKAFENRVRLGIMSILMVNDSVDFNRMKELLHVTDGNLASHISALEKEGYIHVKKEFVGKKPLTTYSATKTGIKAFEDHLNALEKLIKMNQ
ncbi:MAG: winged helix-turn-helix domain-containing protein [Bacteroidota bacterium]